MKKWEIFNLSNRSILIFASTILKETVILNVIFAVKYIHADNVMMKRISKRDTDKIHELKMKDIQEIKCRNCNQI